MSLKGQTHKRRVREKTAVGESLMRGKGKQRRVGMSLLSRRKVVIHLIREATFRLRGKANFFFPLAGEMGEKRGRNCREEG